MATLKIYEVEEKGIQTKKGPQTIKKCVIQEEGKNFPVKNVTVWASYPEYQGVQAGATFTHSYIKVTPQTGSMNPKSGKPYNNYTLEYGAEEGGQQKLGNDQIGIKLDRIESKIDRMESKIDLQLNDKGLDKISKKKDDYPEDEIDPDLIPF